jgi:hypothetical protein
MLLALEVEMVPIACRRQTHELPSFLAHRIQLRLGKEGWTLTNDLAVLPTGFNWHQGRLEPAADRLLVAWRKWNLERPYHDCLLW